MSDTCNIALVGSKFMGRAHSNAWLKVNKFFDTPKNANMHTLLARNPEQTQAFADQWGWQNASTNAQEVLANPDIHLVDITTPNNAHLDLSVAALEAGKHVA